jgi:hypothetical protein
MKNGTGIKLFFQDLPRQFDDINVGFVDHRTPRNETLGQTGASLEMVRV